MYEMFKNSFIMKLQMTGLFDQRKMIIISQSLDETAYDYDVSRKQTEIEVYQDGLPEEVKAYLVTKKIEGYASGTLYNYRKNLTLFFDEMHMGVRNITANDIRVYLLKYQKITGVSNRTLEKIRNSISGLYKWLLSEGYIEKDPTASIKAIKFEEKPKQALTQLDLEYIRKACMTKREKAIIETLYSTGCRVSELTNLKLEDIDFENKTVELFGKGSKYRTSFLNAKSIIALKDYIDTERKETEDRHVFISNRMPYTGMCRSSIEKIVHDIKTRDSHIEKPLTPHILRHTCATVMIRNDASLTSIQKLLGHEQISTTMIYAHNTLDQAKREHEKYIV